jgi:hypothetical protein
MPQDDELPILPFLWNSTPGGQCNSKPAGSYYRKFAKLLVDNYYRKYVGIT